jgi:hypothetical protein
MKNSKTVLLIWGIAVLILAGACARPPTEEMDSAAAAVARAENDAEAVIYAGNTLTRARDALNRMRVEAEAKRYDAAKSYAAEAAAAAEKAVLDGRAGAARAREDAAAMISTAKDALAETGGALDKARTVPGIRLDFDALDRDLESARLTAAQAELDFAGNNYRDALDKGRSARAALSDISTRISAAAVLTSSKK